MIGRVWRGWTSAENADAYEKLLREIVYLGLQTIEGYAGGYTPLGHTPALAGGARELRIFTLRKAQFVTGGIIYSSP